MHESLTGKQIMGYQILGKVKGEQDWEEYRAVKEGVTGRLLRALQVIYYPSQEEYNRYLDERHTQDKKAQEYFAACLQEILDKLSQLELLSEAEDSHLLPIYESDVDWDSQRRQYIIYIIREEALCLPEWEANQDITVEMLLTIGEHMLKAADVYKGSERFHIGDIYMLTKSKFCLGNLEKYVIFGTEDKGENTLISVYHSYIHIFYEASQEMWEQKTIGEKRTIEILCFLYYYLQGKNVGEYAEMDAEKDAEGTEEKNTGQSEKVSRQIWELLIFCTQNQITPSEIANQISSVLGKLDCKEREKVCVSQRISAYSMNSNRGIIEGFKKELKERARECYRGILAGTAFLIILSAYFLVHQRKRETGLKEINTTKEVINNATTSQSNTIKKRLTKESTTIEDTLKESRTEKNTTNKSTSIENTTNESEISFRIKKAETSTAKTRENNIKEKNTTQGARENENITEKSTKQSSNLHTGNYINQNNKINQNENSNKNETEREGWDIQWE